MAASEVDWDSRTADHVPDERPSRRGLPAFSRVYADHFDFVWRCARSFGVAPEAIDDVVQEVFIVVAARLPTLREEDALRSWIYGIVRRRVSRYHRARRVRESYPVEELAVSQLGELSPLEAAERAERLRVLSSLLERLDETKREVFILAEIVEMSVPEIAETIGVPINTAYSRLRAARQLFEQSLVRYLKTLERRGRN